MQQICQICFKNNRSTRDCFYKEMRRNVRNVEVESVKSVSTSEIEEKGELLTNIERNKCGESDLFNDAYILNKPRRMNKMNGKKEKYSKDIIDWANFVDGNGTKPHKPIQKEGGSKEIKRKAFSRGAPTLISESRNERAANKPVVPAIIDLQKHLSGFRL